MENSMFGNTESGNIKYATIVDGAFAIKKSESEATNPDGSLKPNYRKRKNKKEEIVYEFTFTQVAGFLDRVSTRDSEYGVQLALGIKNGDTICVISFNAFNQDGETLTTPAASVGDQIALVDHTKPIELSLYKKDGFVRGVSFKQDGVYIPSRDSNERFKAHIDQRPQPVKKTTLTGDKWDWTAPSAWQWQQIQNSIQKFVEIGVGNNTLEPEESLADAPSLSGELPF